MQAHPLDEAVAVFEEMTASVSIIPEFIGLGFTHIIPKGMDHILFVLGLFFLSLKMSVLFWQVTAFTLAHSVTLAMTIFGVIAISPEIVEPLIALSIAVVAFENIYRKDLKLWRVLVIFIFGLIHGMGFAGVLAELGLPADAQWTALVAFNIGVEFGQIAVVLIALGAVWLMRNKHWYRQWVSIPASVAIGCVGLFWFYQRAVL
ncbi:HupE/UreJ family protein [Oceanicoccus sp. KOV_DT_Chl]|uniref:HupE/UreJ family protein n=1 Tax=Oceanicoccus sp. KOV_DT_Chl TaxID=1904639 RepID=UPI0013582A4D|nr:HupE/UreJ family protein [Oceanicoccus sp. KOV_DT_Chl]